MMRLLRVALLFGASLAPAADAGVCPVRDCAPGAASLLQANSTSRTVRSHTHEAAKTESADGTYNVDYTPGHFICMKCDVTACEDCSILCDLKHCIGEFYSTECWCNKGGGPEQRLLCDGTCEGGLCDAPGQTCQPRDAVCEPWWWCGAPPPKFLQRSSTHQRLSAHGQVVAKERRSGLTQLEKLATEASDATKVTGLTFRDSKYVCQSGALPPKVRDPATFLWVHQGYIAFDAGSCEGATLQTKCYCWDNYRNLQGKDPMTSQFTCDTGCGMGPCEGRTCSLQPPTPPPLGQKPPPLIPLPRLPMEMHVSMESVDPPITQRNPTG